MLLQNTFNLPHDLLIESVVGLGRQRFEQLHAIQVDLLLEDVIVVSRLGLVVLSLEILLQQGALNGSRSTVKCMAGRISLAGAVLMRS